MRHLLLSAVIVSAAALAPAAENATLAGKWQIHNSIAGNESDQTCTFTQQEGELAGSCTSERGALKVTGKVDGKSVTWTYKTEYNGEPLTITYKASLESAGKFSGSVTVEEMGISGEFTATLAKEP